MLLQLFYMSFAIAVPLSGSDQTSPSPVVESVVIPDILQMVMAPESLDDHVLDQQIAAIAQKEKTNDEGAIVENFPDVALNLQDFRKILAQNDRVVFDILKQIFSGIIHGCFNLVYDNIKSFFQSPLASFIPDPETSVWDFLLMALFRLIMYGLILRLSIFFTPFRPLRAILMRIQYYTMCSFCEIF